MQKPELRKLVRSLRTKSHEKLEINKYYNSFSQRRKSKEGDFSSQEKSISGKESHG